MATAVRVPAGLVADRRVATTSFAARSQSTKKVVARGQEDKLGRVRRPGWPGIHLRVERVAEPVGGEDLRTPVPHVRRPMVIASRIRCTPGRIGCGAGWRGLLGVMFTAWEVEHVRSLGFVEQQRVGDVATTLSDTPRSYPALEAGVVVDADPGEQRDFLPTQSGDAAVAAEGGQAGLLRVTWLAGRSGSRGSRSGCP